MKHKLKKDSESSNSNELIFVEGRTMAKTELSAGALETFDIEEIRILKRHRVTKAKKVAELATSLQLLGLQTPLTVRRRKDGQLNLIAGRHRLEAARTLGWKQIPCFVVQGRKKTRRLWAISENLHRAGLTQVQRADLAREWDRLTKKAAKAVQVAHPGGVQPHDKGISRLASSLGVSREEARRMLQIAEIAPEAKQAATEVGLDNNQSALLEISEAGSSVTQFEKVQEIAAKKLSRTQTNKRAIRRGGVAGEISETKLTSSTTPEPAQLALESDLDIPELLIRLTPNEQKLADELVTRLLEVTEKVRKFVLSRFEIPHLSGASLEQSFERQEFAQ